MDRSGLATYFKENVGLVHSAARKGAARAAAVGCSTLDHDDFVQELTEVFIKAYDLHDPTKTRFSTYFMRSAYNHINKMMEKVNIERMEMGVRSVEEMSSWNQDDDGGELGFTVEDVTAIGPEEAAQMNSMVNAWHAKLSPGARLVLEWTLNPPDFIENEFLAQLAHAEMARDMGLPRRSRLMIDASFVSTLLKQVTGKQAFFGAALEEVKSVARSTL